MANDDEILENIDQQLEKLKENILTGDKKDTNKVATGRRCKRGKHEHVENSEKFEETKAFNAIETMDTKIFDAAEVKDEALMAEETTKLNTTIVDAKEVLVEEELEKTKANKSIDEEVINSNDSSVEEMSNTFVDKSPFADTTDKKLKKEVKIIIILIIGVLLILGLIIGFWVVAKNKEKDKEKVIIEKELTEKQKEKLVNKYGENLEKVITEELEANDVLLEYEVAIKLVKSKEKIKCHENAIYQDGSVYLNKCSINGIMTKYSYGEMKDVSNNKLKVYVEMSSGKATLIKPSASKETLYNVYEVDCGDNYSDVYLLNDYVVYYDAAGLVQMRDYKNDEKVLKNINYKEVIPIKLGNNSYDVNNVVVLVGDFFGIYKLTGEQVISPMYSDIVADINKSVTKRNSINVISNNLIAVSDGNNYGVIDYTNNKTIVPLEFTKIILNGNYLLVTTNNDGNLYDFTGREYLINSNVYGSVGNKYFIIKDDNMIKLSLIDGKKIYDYGIISSIGKFYSSKMQDKKITFQFLDTNTNGRCIEFIYDISNEAGEYTSNKSCGIN